MRSALFACTLLFVFWPACAQRASTSGECAPKHWAGKCELRTTAKLEDNATPIPHVVLEAVYTPQTSASSPEYTPPEAHERLWVATQYEVDLIDHLQRNRVVECHLPEVQGTCIPTKLSVAVPPFDPAQADAAREQPRAPGCGQIESTADQERLARQTDTKTQFTEQFLFDENSAALSPEATSTAQQIAARLKANQKLQCVAVVGQSASGESPSLPEQRARAVRELLVSLGVERHRLITITLTASVFGSGAKPQEEAQASHRRVSFRVLLENPSGGKQ